MPDLRDNVVLITGGAGGIGLALAREAVARGAQIALADISLDEARSAAASIGSQATAYHCDVTDRESLAALAGQIRQDLGSLNLVFANAGVAIGGRLHMTAASDFDWLVDVNIRGTFNTVQAFVPALTATARDGGPAKLVFTGSENSVGLPSTGEMTAYTATKHAILAFADGCRRDLRDAGVEVAIFCPGLVATRLYDSRRSRQDRYGGASPLAGEVVRKMEAMMSEQGQDPADTARLCLDGLARGEFLIITDPKIRAFAETRHAEVEEALDRLDALNAAHPA